MAFDHSKFIARFVEEAGTHCARISEGLLNLDKTPQDPEVLHGLFRSAHTIKGSSRMIKITGVSELAHKMEDVLDAARSGKIALTSALTDVLFRAVDALTAMLAKVKGGDIATPAPAEVCQALADAATASAIDPATQGAPAAPPATAAPEAPVAPTVAAPAPAAAAVPPPASAASAAPPAPTAHVPKAPTAEYLRVHAAKLDDLVRLMGEIVSEHGRHRRQLRKLCDLERQLARHIVDISKALESSGGGVDKSPNPGNAELATTMQGLHARLHQMVRGLSDASLVRDHLVTGLQDTSLRLRMQPLSTVFDPLRRTVRDLAHECGKDVEFLVDGGETELDRKIIDRIGDSLVHLIRNALDHGVESVEERQAANKTPKGRITLSACYDSGCVVIAMADDGRGIDIERIRDKAASKRLFAPEELATMPRAAIIDLIFLPGFSTSPIITDISGRGVGMDVVRKNIAEELRGTITVESAPGQGTTFLLRLPLHLAVFSLFFFSAAGRVCALPKISLVEMYSTDRSEIIDIVHRRAIRLREQIIPVENVDALIGLEQDAPQAPGSGEVLIAMVRNGEEKLGLIVDDIIGCEDMVVKPLPPHLRKHRLVAGVTVGEQDQLINVLHVPELFRLAREIRQPAPRAQAPEVATPQRVLVVDDSINTREIEKSILEAYGYDVTLAEDGEDGWDKTRSTLFDLVITDVEMPRLDGFSFTERLRADEQYRRIPVIIVTSREKEEDKRRGIQVGANAYIVKGSFDQSNLIETVRNLLG
ncbi:hybrid sensor histidine kinase/response regulator [Candidatus Symbiobacter mobilis]|uniref:Chemotaxis protein CheA n=1 Tax=Candidatus Symbiobacter mobilis CR TaxID=946483 RepID=U5NDF7_9BURK|nr:hybrid sensor histidine kinase/response regulator [Candidatus Symbiobacter mobilis]AGX88209.1 chemotaxis histidine kinase-like protein [Candidatus Symbiobacter mobilis CR]